MSDDGGKAGAILETQMDSQGVGCIRVKDGQVFLFSERTLQNLLEQAKASPEKKALVFVKAGPLADKALV